MQKMTASFGGRNLELKASCRWSRSVELEDRRKLKQWLHTGVSLKIASKATFKIVGAEARESGEKKATVFETPLLGWKSGNRFHILSTTTKPRKYVVDHVDDSSDSGIGGAWILLK